MARIPEDQLDRLKQDISLQRLAEGMGIVLKRHGADLIGLCPFHDDREPSLVITRKQPLALSGRLPASSLDGAKRNPGNNGGVHQPRVIRHNNDPQYYNRPNQWGTSPVLQNGERSNVASPQHSQHNPVLPGSNGCNQHVFQTRAR